MTIYDYIEEYGNYTFQERKINEVDYVIFSFLSYANIKDIMEENNNQTIQEIAKKHKEKYQGKDNNIIAVKEGNKLLRSLMNKKRYNNCRIKDYEYRGDDTIQFGAMSIEYLPNKVFISFEGTDQLFSGWKENFLLSYEFPTKSHIAAISYINKHFTFKRKEIIVGGHSKGGNLALVAGMYANIFCRNKIKKIINADGPGLLDKEFQSKRYKNIEKKYTHIIPDQSLVGLFLNHSKDIVVKSSMKGILAHNICYWNVNNNHFEKTELSAMSKELDKKIQIWFQNYSIADKESFTKNLSEILTKANIKTITELKENHLKIITLISKSKYMDEKTKKILEEFIKMVIECIKTVTNEEWKSFMSDFFRVKKKK